MRGEPCCIYDGALRLACTPQHPYNCSASYCHTETATQRCDPSPEDSHPYCIPLNISLHPARCAITADAPSRLQASDLMRRVTQPLQELAELLPVGQAPLIHRKDGKPRWSGCVHMSPRNTAHTACGKLFEEVACTSGRHWECFQVSGCPMLKKLLMNLLQLGIAVHVDATCTPYWRCCFFLQTGMPFQLLLLTN